MTKLFAVEIKYVTVVVAHDADDARHVAEDEVDSIVRDANGPDSVLTLKEIRSESDLRGLHGNWTGNCLPYGDGTDTTIKEHLESTDE